MTTTSIDNFFILLIIKQILNAIFAKIFKGFRVRYNMHYFYLHFTSIFCTAPNNFLALLKQSVKTIPEEIRNSESYNSFCRKLSSSTFTFT